MRTRQHKDLLLRLANQNPATSCSAPGIGLIAIAPYNRLMAWHRLLLALAFLTSTLLGNVTVVSAPLAKMDSGMAMDMHGAGAADQGLMPENCNSCHKTGDAMLPCLPACGMGTVPVSNISPLNLSSDAVAFDLPRDQDLDGANYPPVPHPPKFPLFS